MPTPTMAHPKWLRVGALTGASSSGVLVARLWSGHTLALTFLAALLVGTAQQGLP